MNLKLSDKNYSSQTNSGNPSLHAPKEAQATWNQAYLLLIIPTHAFTVLIIEPNSILIHVQI